MTRIQLNPVSKQLSLKTRNQPEVRKTTFKVLVEYEM